jgi:hypothetical protein
MQTSLDTTFDAPDVHFDNLHLFIDTRGEKFGNPKCYDYPVLFFLLLFHWRMCIYYPLNGYNKHAQYN